jgi:hypothetical protein
MTPISDASSPQLLIWIAKMQQVSNDAGLKMQTWEQDFVSTFGYPHRRTVPVRYAPAVRLWRQKARTGILGGQPLKFLFSHNVLVNIMGF